MATPIEITAAAGIVTLVKGTVTASFEGGDTRLLKAGDRVFEGETVRCSANGGVSLEFSNGGRMDLGRGGSALIDAKLLTALPTEEEGTLDRLAAANQSGLAQGSDPSRFDATNSRGGGASRDPIDESQVVEYIGRTGRVGRVSAGYETRGIEQSFESSDEFLGNNNRTGKLGSVDAGYETRGFGHDFGDREERIGFEEDHGSPWLPPPPLPIATIRLVAVDDAGNILPESRIAEGEDAYYKAILVGPNGVEIPAPAGASVDIVFFDHTATQGAGDYQGSNQTVLIGQIFSASALDNYFSDSGETFQVALVDGSHHRLWLPGYSGVREEAAPLTTTITDGASEPDGGRGAADTLYVRLLDSDSAAEGEALTHRVLLVDSAGNPVTVAAGETLTITLGYAPNGASGVDASDYSAQTTVTLTAGNSEVSFSNPALDDLWAEGDEGYTATIAGIAQSANHYENLIAHPTDNRVTGTLTDGASEVDGGTGAADTLYVRLLGSDIAAEGESLFHRVQLVDKDGNPVVVPAGQSVTITLNYAPSGADGAEADDYSAQVSVTITAGHSEATITNATADDHWAEGDEGYTATNAGLSQTGAFEQMAVHPTDHRVTGTITDGASEPDGGTGVADTLYIRLLDSDSAAEGEVLAHRVQLVDSAGNPVVVPPGETISVILHYAPSGANGADASDYVAQTIVTLTAGNSETSFSNPALDDFWAEAAEGYNATIAGIAQAANSIENLTPHPVDNSVTGTITDRGAEPDGGLGAADTVYVRLDGDATTQEGSGDDLTHRITLVNQAGNPVHLPRGETLTLTLHYDTLADVDGTEEADFTSRTTSLTLVGDGGSSYRFSNTAAQDVLAEGTEGYRVSVQSIDGSSGTFENLAVDTLLNSAEGRITDGPADTADDWVYLRLGGDASAQEGTGETLSHQITLVDKDGNQVNLAAGETISLTLRYGAIDGVDGIEEADLASRTTTLTLTGNGGARYDFSNLIAEDFLAEGTEGYRVAIASIDGSSGAFENLAIDASNNSATGLIGEERLPGEAADTVTLRLIPTDALGNEIPTSQVFEGENAYYKVILVDPDGREITGAVGTVDIQITEGSAGDADYGAAMGVVHTLPGVAIGHVFAIDTIDDPLADSGETFRVALVDGTGLAPAYENLAEELAPRTTRIYDEGDPAGPSAPPPSPYGPEDSVTLTLSGSPQVDEGGTLTHHLAWTGPDGNSITPSLDVQVTLRISPQPGGLQFADLDGNSDGIVTVSVAGHDYSVDTVTGLVVVTLPAGQASIDLTLDSRDDFWAEGSESYRIDFVGRVSGGGFERIETAGTSTGTLDDSDGPLSPADAQLFEANLHDALWNPLTTQDGDLTGLPPTGIPAGYSLTFDAAALPTGITANGQPLQYAIAGNVLTAYTSDPGNPVFVLTLNRASGDYRFELFQPLDHAAPDGLPGGRDEALPLDFTFLVADGPDRNSGTFTVTVQDAAPNASSPQVATAEDSAVLLHLTDTPVAGGTLTVDGHAIGAGGEVWLDATGHVVDATDAVGQLRYQGDGRATFTPVEDYSGTPGFTYTITDGDGDSTSGSATLDVTPRVEPDLAFDSLADLTINEDGRDEDSDQDTSPTPLTLAIPDPASQMLDRDGSESVSDITINDIPAGATLYLNGVAVPTAGGSYTLSGFDRATDTVSILPPPDSDTDFTLSYGFTVTDSRAARWDGATPLSDSQAYTITQLIRVQGVADNTDVGALGNETMSEQSGSNIAGAWFYLADVVSRAELSYGDTSDGSEARLVRIDGLPSDGYLSVNNALSNAGWSLATNRTSGSTPLSTSGYVKIINNGDGTASVILSASYLDGTGTEAKIRMPNVEGDFALDVRSVAIESDWYNGLASKGNWNTAIDWSGNDNAGDRIGYEVSDSRGLTLTVAPAGGDFTVDFPPDQVEDNGNTTDGISGIRLFGANGFTITGSDTSEALTQVTVSGIPADVIVKDGSGNPLPVAGGVLSIAIGAGPGQYSEAAAEAFTLTLPRDSSGNLALTYTLTSSDSGGPTTDAVFSHTLRVSPDADLPLTQGDQGYAGVEDRWIAIDRLSAAISEVGAGHVNETLTVSLSGAPAGSRLEIGGVVTAITSPSQSVDVPLVSLDSVRLLPPKDFSGTLQLTMTTTVTDRDEDAGDNLTDTATASDTLAITVTGDADKPILTVRSVAGAEDAGRDQLTGDVLDYGTGGIAIGARLSVTSTDTNQPAGPESVGLQISNIPVGVQLFSGGREIAIVGGVALVDPDQVAGLLLLPPHHSNVDFDLMVQARAVQTDAASDLDRYELGDPATLHVSLTGVADLPNLAASASDSEDQWIDLSIAVSLNDSDGSESLYAVIQQVPDSWRLRLLDTDGNDISSHLTLAGHGGGATDWRVEPTDLAAGARAQLLPPADFAGQWPISVKAVTAENDGAVETSVQQTVRVDVAPIMDTTGGPITVTAYEDGVANLDPGDGTPDDRGQQGNDSQQWIALNLPMGGAESSESVKEGSIWLHTPAGVQVRFIEEGRSDFSLLSNGNSAGDFILTNSEARSLQVLAPLHGSDTIDGFVFTRTLVDIGDRDARTTAETQLVSEVSVDLTGVADGMETFTVQDGGDNQAGVTAIITGATPIDEDGSESVYYVVENAAGISNNTTWTIDGAINRGANVWVVEDPAAATIRVLDRDAGDGTLNLQITPVTQERDGDLKFDTANTRTFTLTYTNNAGAPLPPDGDGSDASDPLPADKVPTINGGTPNTIGQSVDTGPTDEDVDFVGTGLTVTAPPDVRISYVIKGILHGTLVPHPDLILLPNGHWVTTNPDAIRIQPEPQYDGQIGLEMDVVGTMASGEESIFPYSIQIPVLPITDAPTVSATGGIETDSGDSLPLHITLGSIDRDGSEGFAPGSSVSLRPLDGGTLSGTGVTDNGDGTFRVDDPAANLGAVRFTPPAYSHGSFDFEIAYTWQDGSAAPIATASTFTIALTSEVDGITATLSTALGSEGQPLPLDVRVFQADADGSEVASVVIQGVPSDARLSAGSLQPNGTWLLTAAETAGLQLVPEAHFGGSFDLRLKALSYDLASGGIHESAYSDPVTVTIAPVASDIVLSGFDAQGAEDSGLKVDLDLVMADTDGSETLSLVFTGVPDGAGFRLNGIPTGAYDGSGNVTLSGLNPADLENLSFHAPAHFSGSIPIGVQLYTVDGIDILDAPVSDSLTFTFTPVADPAILTTGSTSAAVGQPIPLDIQAILVDNDGSETWSVLIETGGKGTLNQGTHLGGGDWSLTAVQLAGLTFTPTAGGTFDLVIQAVTTEGENGQQAIVQKTLTIDASSDPFTATAVDGIIAGLAYETSSGISGYTDADGNFEYMAGDTVVFKLGHVVIGDLDTGTIQDGQVFLQDIAGVERTDLNDDYVENMAVLLQSLDANGNAYDGIVITEAMHQAFSQEGFDLAILSEAELRTMIELTGRDAVSEEDAMQHVQEMLTQHAGIAEGDFQAHVADPVPVLESIVEPTPEPAARPTPSIFALDDGIVDLSTLIEVRPAPTTGTSLYLGGDQSHSLHVSDLFSSISPSAFQSQTVASAQPFHSSSAPVGASQTPPTPTGGEAIAHPADEAYGPMPPQPGQLLDTHEPAVI